MSNRRNDSFIRVPKETHDLIRRRAEREHRTLRATVALAFADEAVLQ